MVNRYPWDKWFHRKKFILTRHRDYPGQPHGMAAQVRNAACRRDLSVSIRIDGDVLVVKMGGR